MLIHQMSTQALPVQDQFGFAHEMLISAPIPVRIERPGLAASAPFRAFARLHAYGSDIVAIDSGGDGADGIRARPEMARTSADCFWIVRYRIGAGPIDLGDTRVIIGPGDIVFGDCSVGMVGRGGSCDVSYTMWMIPRALMQPLLADSAVDPKGVLRAGEPLGALVGGYLDHLGAAMDQLGAARAEPLMTHVAAMIALRQGIGDHAIEVAQNAVAAGRLDSIGRLIALRFADPAFSVRDAAGEHGISIRSLHALFEPTGKSFGRHLLETRLAAAHALLTERHEPRRTVLDIAYACGFEALSTFYRTFRDRYGYSPTELREGR